MHSGGSSPLAMALFVTPALPRSHPLFANLLRLSHYTNTITINPCLLGTSWKILFLKKRNISPFTLGAGSKKI
jgi:hypothetical protein